MGPVVQVPEFGRSAGSQPDEVVGGPFGRYRYGLPKFTHYLLAPSLSFGCHVDSGSPITSLATQGWPSGGRGRSDVDGAQGAWQPGVRGPGRHHRPGAPERPPMPDADRRQREEPHLGDQPLGGGVARPSPWSGSSVGPAARARRHTSVRARWATPAPLHFGLVTESSRNTTSGGSTSAPRWRPDHAHDPGECPAGEYWLLPFAQQPPAGPGLPAAGPRPRVHRGQAVDQLEVLGGPGQQLQPGFGRGGAGAVGRGRRSLPAGQAHLEPGVHLVDRDQLAGVGPAVEQGRAPPASPDLGCEGMHPATPSTGGPAPRAPAS